MSRLGYRHGVDCESVRGRFLDGAVAGRPSFLRVSPLVPSLAGAAPLLRTYASGETGAARERDTPTRLPVVVTVARPKQEHEGARMAAMAAVGARALLF